MKDNKEFFIERVKAYSGEAAEQNIDRVFSEIDQNRLIGLKKMSRIRQVKAKTLEKEKLFLKNKYGQEDARVRNVELEISANREYARSVDLEISKAEVELTVVDKNSFVVHGKVFDIELRPLADMIVALYDNNGKRLKQVDYVCTDKSGYFKITVTMAKSEAAAIVKSDISQEGPLPHSTLRVLDEKSARQFQNEKIANIFIFDKNKKLIYKSDNQVNLKLDFITYREIIIDEICTECVAPPDDVSGKKPKVTKRKTAQPTTSIRVTAKKKRQENKAVEDIAPAKKKQARQKPRPKRKKVVAKKKAISKKTTKRTVKKSTKRRVAKSRVSKVKRKKNSTKVKKRPSKKK